MSEQIKNPYVANYGKITCEWGVLYRYLIADKIKFKFVCSCLDSTTAKQIARLLNSEHEEKQDA